MTYQRPRPRTKYCGIYAIVHKPSGRMYIGSSSDITQRYTHHRYMLRRGIHKTVELQRLWTLDGEEAFEFKTIQRCERGDLVALEDEWLATTDNVLNTVRRAITGFESGGPSDVKKEAARRRWRNPAYRAKQEAAQDRRYGR